eukprot:TRINITY_DN8581_c0_g1_i1.p1 TRINITY_DN8581_c0_g1~~TRINITY_DN8581_c0_g1_i1.p1  ORF type:complete len:413 (-),score=115.93 TRINITY_DN8581_c0_g1_i1:36-1274(-)
MSMLGADRPVEKRRHEKQGLEITSISNFRDFGGRRVDRPGLVTRPRMLFRSGAPTWASPQDTQELLHELGVKTLVDFRTTFETKSFSTAARFEDNFFNFSIKKDESCASASSSSSGHHDIDRIDSAKEDLIMEQQQEGRWTRFRRISVAAGGPLIALQHSLNKDLRASIQTSEALEGRKHYSIPLINDHYFFKGVYTTAPAKVQMQCTIARWALWNDKVGALFLMRHLNDMGLFEMYRLTLEYTRKEILTILRILKNPDNYPIMIFCSLGKDRTGMISALVQSCLGVPRDTIISDYHLSEKNLEPNMEKLKKYFNRIGLTKEEFVLAPSAVMTRLLEYLDEKYGSVCNYLTDIGFAPEEQEMLRTTLLVQEDHPQVQAMQETAATHPLHPEHHHHHVAHLAKQPIETGFPVS